MNRPLSRYAATAIAWASMSAATALAIGAQAAEPPPGTLQQQASAPKQTQGATFGEKVNAGLQAAGGSAATASPRATTARDATRAADALPANASNPDPNAPAGNDSTAAAVGTQPSGAGSGAASASYAATGKAVPPAGSAAGGADSPVEGKKTRKPAARHDTAKNSVGNVR